jgi:CelD/BcsL family acetyltransferase involved in cellulose biosynthesis
MKISRLDFDNFKTIRHEWNKLLHDSGATSIFLTWEWVSTWWETYGDSPRTLYILVAHDEDENLVGIAPCYVTIEKMFKLLSFKEIRFLGYGSDIHPDYLDFIATPQRRAEIINAFFSYFLENPADWDVMNLTDLLEDSHCIAHIASLKRQNGIHFIEARSATCPYASLPDSWETYLRNLSSSTRYDIRRKMRKLERDFDVRFYTWDDATTLETAMEKLRELHIRRWDQESVSHGFANRRFNEFHHRVANEFLKLGLLRLYVLEANGLIVSMLYCYKYKDKLFFYQSGFDPDYSKYSVGTVLFANAIQHAISEHITEFDFLRGYHDYKYSWGKADRPTFRVAVRRNSLAGRLYFVDSFWKQRFKDYLRENLPPRMVDFLRYVRRMFQSNKAKDAEQISFSPQLASGENSRNRE